MRCDQRDLCDGVRLRELLEVLSGKSVAIPHSKADTRLKQLSNVTAILNFLQDEEKLRLLSIGKTRRAYIYILDYVYAFLTSTNTVFEKINIRKAGANSLH